VIVILIEFMVAAKRWGVTVPEE